MTTAPVDHLNSGAEPADPRHPPIHRLIERQAAARPDQPAIVAGRTVLSYRELNGRANALAHHLRALGAAPEVRIGTCLSRSPDAVVSALGIVKSGAAPVLIDPAVPADRVRFMLRDSGARLLVTSAATMAAAPELGAALAAADPRSVLLDRDAPTLARYPAVDPPAVLT